VDLGCGSGVLLAAACLGGFGLKHVLGIELNSSKVVDARLLMHRVGTISDTPCEIVEGNFLCVPWDRCLYSLPP
jgi:predicted RNA methylase